MQEYFLFLASKEKHFCGIEKTPQSLMEKGWRIRKGIRMDHRYPPDVGFHMSSMFSGILVPDMVRNLCALCIVSDKLKALLDEECPEEIEYLPCAIYNHKGRVASPNHYIANVVGTEDCVDLERTEARESQSEPGTFLRLTRLFLDSSRIKPDSKLFRIQQMPRVMVIREDLRQVLEKNKISGVTYVSMGEPTRLP